ncbi:hypothetical protein [Cellulomonas pakistanensis]|uniref:DUF4188 domain-containing protein n=1 Tax=Cellulomonas pakistanensis TaxID=992287 RepID=A0A919PBP2_9CELL|nr:hypothetical protein [Cellulomonas pakistanensis]GIG35297.1 hypothetical protein Cpa01nite_06780 [Cellulomonas pakistanensis]
MRTSDFSRTPPLGRAEALVVTDRVRSAAGAPGMVRQRRFRERDLPGGVARRRGVLAFFATLADAERFAADAERSAAGTGGGFAHVYAAEPEGYSNGVWRAEDRSMAHVERFAALSGEVRRGVEPPRVAEGGDGAPGYPRRPGGSSGRREGGGRRGRATGADRPAGARGPRAHPGLADARAMFVGATRYTGPLAWLALARTWYPMVAKMQRLRGFRWYAVYWSPPFTLGTLAFFSGRDELLAFARMPEHRDLMRWITDGERWGTGGYIRLHGRVDAAARSAAADPADPDADPVDADPADDAGGTA